ncbi:hypothetical protein [Accumulibacter sp.]
MAAELGLARSTLQDWGKQRGPRKFGQQDKW